MSRHGIVDWIALNLLPRVGPITARRMLEAFHGPAEVAFRAPPEDFRRVGRVPAAAVEEIRAARRSLRREAEREAKLAEKNGVRVLACDDPGYPAAIVELPDAPVLLYCRGELPEGVLRMAVVGSRTPTPYGVKNATGLAGGLAARGIEVVSGGALGVDTAAHRGALAEGGRTVAVLGSGLLVPYPDRNERLFWEIAEQGAVLSEFPLRFGSLPENFPRRNRLISGLSAAVIVVEAAERSGSLITAGHALEQGREVMAVPGPVQSRKSQGCHKLIQQGAKLVQEIGDIVDELPPIFRAAVGRDPALEAAETGPNLEGATADERDVLGILSGTEPVQLDELARRVGFGIARLQTALFGLEIRGAVEQWPGRYYVLRPKKER